MEQRGESSLTFCVVSIERTRHTRATSESSTDDDGRADDDERRDPRPPRVRTPSWQGVDPTRREHTPRTAVHTHTLLVHERARTAPVPRPVRANARTTSAVHVKPAKDGPQTHTPRAHRTESGKVLCTPAHARLPNSVILRANHVDLHHARPLTLVLPLPSEDTVDL